MSHHYEHVDWTSIPSKTEPFSGRAVPLNEPRQSFRTPIILFCLTVLSTIWAGCLQQDINVFAQPWLFYRGLPFSITLLLILGVHEAGHYIMCRVHGVPATVPYFIPMPNFLGTMGAFIRIKGSITSKIALLDIGMAGPLAGFALALPATIIGYMLSGSPTPIFVQNSLILGNSLLTKLLELVFYGSIPKGYSLSLGSLHPIAFAGYIGLFVTSMNLLPVGQLDGGHVISAMFGKQQWQIAKTTIGFLVVCGLFWSGWWMWAVLLLLFGLKHPVIRYDARSPGHIRRILAWITVGIFFLTFVPVPFSFVSFTP